MLLINFLKKASVHSVIKCRKILMLFLFPTIRRIFTIIFLFSFGLLSVTAKVNFQNVDSISIEQATQQLELAKQNNNIEAQGEALYAIGLYYLDSSKVVALDYFKESTLILERHDHILLSDLYYDQSQIYTTFSEFPEALRLGLKSLQLNTLNNRKSKILRDMSHIGYLYDRMYEFKESIQWNRDALEIARQIGDLKGEALCLGRIGIAYDELAEKDNFNKRLFDSALFYNLKAAKLSESINDYAFARTTYSNIGNSYSKLKQFDKAEEYTLKSLSVPGYDDRKGVTLVNLGKIYLETGRYLEARKILDSALQNTIKYGTRKYQLEAYYRFHELNVKQGNYKSALNNYIRYKSIEDSLLNETKTRQIVEIGERFKTAEKERQILLHRAQIAEQDLTIQRRNYQLIFVISLIFLVGLIGYLIYKQQKSRNIQLKKENELKDALVKIETQNKLQEQRLSISRDLHDNIGSQLTFITSSLDNLKYKFELPNNLEDQIKEIKMFTSITINELRDTIWAMNKSVISLEELISRIQDYSFRANLADDRINIVLNCDISNQTSYSFSSLVGINIYRIIQEGINNAIRHANASKININIAMEDECINFIIEDNGEGFDIDSIVRGNGLNNINHRSAEINSELTLESVLNQGSKIVFKVCDFKRDLI